MIRPLVACALAAPLIAPAPAPARPDYPHRTYATCYALSGRMADGTRVRSGSAASNVLRLGTRIRLDRTFYGLRTFVIRDTGGALGDGHLDLWHPSRSACLRWGHRAVRYRVVR